ncbi:flagellar hook-length control protein FliK, partial [Halomonas heilongjiangensis]
VATPAATQATLPAPLATPAWPQQFTQQVGQQLAMLGQRGGEQRIELHLNPAELGPLTVSLKVSGQAAQAQFLSAHAPVRSAVEQAIPQLREALAEQGISLGEASVGEQPRDEAPRDFAGRGSAGAGVAGEPGDELDGHGASATTAAADIALDGRVDLYA